MLPKKSAYVKSHNGETKSMFFSIGAEQLLKKLGKIVARIKSPIVWKRNFIANLPAIRNFYKRKWKTATSLQIFMIEKFLK